MSLERGRDNLEFLVLSFVSLCLLSLILEDVDLRRAFIELAVQLVEGVVELVVVHVKLVHQDCVLFEISNAHIHVLDLVLKRIDGLLEILVFPYQNLLGFLGNGVSEFVVQFVNNVLKSLHLGVLASSSHIDSQLV